MTVIGTFSFSIERATYNRGIWDATSDWFLDLGGGYMGIGFIKIS
jgi:hypothetical protein